MGSLRCREFATLGVQLQRGDQGTVWLSVLYWLLIADAQSVLLECMQSMLVMDLAIAVGAPGGCAVFVGDWS